MGSRNSGNKHMDMGSLSRIGLAAKGAVLGWFFGLLVRELFRDVLPWVGRDYTLPICTLTWGLLAYTRFRRMLWWPPGILAALTAIVGFTPVMSGLMRSLVLEEAPRKADAVVVLASDVFMDGGMTCAAQARVIKAYELLSEGYAPRLVLSRGPGKFADWSGAVREQMRGLHLDYPVFLTQHVNNTRQEALAVARLARRHKWTRFLLVTHPWHMRRAVAVFRHAGVPVTPVPCDELGYDLHSLAGFADRLAAFRNWAHESLGYWMYKWRGWV